jgi:hypothetical protein
MCDRGRSARGTRVASGVCAEVWPWRPGLGLVARARAADAWHCVPAEVVCPIALVINRAILLLAPLMEGLG